MQLPELCLKSLIQKVWMVVAGIGNPDNGGEGEREDRWVVVMSICGRGWIGFGLVCSCEFIEHLLWAGMMSLYFHNILRSGKKVLLLVSFCR